MQKAHELGIDPFEILLLFAAERYEALGYSERTTSKETQDGKVYEIWTISPEMRLQAAKEATQYLLPKRKATEHSLSEIPDDAFNQEVERRVHLKILKGEIKASDVS